MVRWLATLKVVGSPFHDSALTEYVGHGLRIVWWVWLGGTQNHFLVQTVRLLVFVKVARVGVGGLAHCWVLRRHLVGVFSVPLPGLGVLTPPDQRCCWVLCVGVVVPVGLGVWWCVECCIVDASILLWSSY